MKYYALSGWKNVVRKIVDQVEKMDVKGKVQNLKECIFSKDDFSVKRMSWG